MLSTERIFLLFCQRAFVFARAPVLGLCFFVSVKPHAVTEPVKALGD